MLKVITLIEFGGNQRNQSIISESRSDITFVIFFYIVIKCVCCNSCAFGNNTASGKKVLGCPFFGDVHSLLGTGESNTAVVDGEIIIPAAPIWDPGGQSFKHTKSSLMKGSEALSNGNDSPCDFSIKAVG